MKIIIKLPNKKINKFRLQKYGVKGRRYLRAISLLNALSRYKLKEKTLIAVKELSTTRYEVINETVASTNLKYLLYTTSCFLEDYLSAEMLKKFAKYADEKI
jgi:hypothetical protein